MTQYFRFKQFPDGKIISIELKLCVKSFITKIKSFEWTHVEFEPYDSPTLKQPKK